MKLLVEIPDDDSGWAVETADERHRFAGEQVLSYQWDDAPPDIKILRSGDSPAIALAKAVHALADERGHAAEGWVVLYYFPKGSEAYGVGSLDSGGEVWASIRRMNENNLAQHIAAALRMRANPNGQGIITPN